MIPLPKFISTAISEKLQTAAAKAKQAAVDADLQARDLESKLAEHTQKVERLTAARNQLAEQVSCAKLRSEEQAARSVLMEDNSIGILGVRHETPGDWHRVALVARDCEYLAAQAKIQGGILEKRLAAADAALRDFMALDADSVAAVLVKERAVSEAGFHDRLIGRVAEADSIA